jgi:hypothetical protein
MMRPMGAMRQMRRDAPDEPDAAGCAQWWVWSARQHDDGGRATSGWSA